jgi:hypothetical protein
LLSARQKVLDKEATADVQFAETSLPRVTLGKGFAECFLGFAECLKHSAKAAVSDSGSIGTKTHAESLGAENVLVNVRCIAIQAINAF